MSSLATTLLLNPWRFARRRWLSGIGWGLFGLAVIATIAVRRQLPWVPLAYLAALIGCGTAGWRLTRWRSGPRRIRWPLLVGVAVTAVALCPVPWMRASLDAPPGTAWRLDGRLTVEGVSVDPPGAWYWLTVGRPPLVAELVLGALFSDEPPATDMRTGRAASQPRYSEPAAAAVGLRYAGQTVDWGVMVELSGPFRAGLPERAVVAQVNGEAIEHRRDWDRALGELSTTNSFTTTGGATYSFAESELPYRRVSVVDAPAEDLHVAVGGFLAGTPPGRWWRSLALGKSHGMMVALVTYAHFAGVDLAEGRSIAGTGGIRADGTVSPISGLRAKAGAARDVGADVMFFPASQQQDLAGFDSGSMRLVPVSSIDDAIAYLQVGAADG